MPCLLLFGKTYKETIHFYTHMMSECQSYVTSTMINDWISFLYQLHRQKGCGWCLSEENGIGKGGHFYLNEILNKQNCWIWISIWPNASKEFPLQSPNIFVWLVIYGRMIIDPDIYEKNNTKGLICFVTAEKVRHMLNKFCIPSL